MFEISKEIMKGQKNVYENMFDLAKMITNL